MAKTEIANIQENRTAAETADLFPIAIVPYDLMGLAVFRLAAFCNSPSSAGDRDAQAAPAPKTASRF